MSKKLKRTLGRRKKKKQASGGHETFSQQNTLQQALALQQAGRLPEAEILYNKVLSVQPNNPFALNLLGGLLNQVGKSEKAVELIRKALTSKPDFTDAHYNLGIILGVQGKLDEAASCFQRVISLKPDFAHVHYNFGVVLMEQGKLDEAIANYRQALVLKPDNFMALYNLGKTFKEQGKLDEAIASYRQVLNLKPNLVKAHDNMLFTLNYMSNATQEEIFNESLQWEKTFAEFMQKDNPRYENSLRNDRTLRIGYVSPDFRMHSVFFFIEPVIKAHNRERVEVFCYANVKKPDGASQHLQDLADHWISIIGKSDEEIVSRIKKDKIDILVDLAGHTKNNNLPVFARRPAPIQVTWLGYPNSTGLKTIDYRLTDAIADPLGDADIFHSEKLIRLNHGFLCYHPVQSVPKVNSLPCRDRAHITFGSFNNLTKVRPEVIRAWVGILHAVPDSHLLLKAEQFSNEQTMMRFKEIFAKEGITHERLKIYKKLPINEEHLGMYNRVDIGLDTFPYNGTTTTCEALMMGVPVVTMLGDRHASRVSASILHRIGLEELVALSVDKYIELARSLALDQNYLQEMRSGLRDRMQESELMDSELFTNHLEKVYLQMWQEYCESVQIKK